MIEREVLAIGALLQPKMRAFKEIYDRWQRLPEITPSRSCGPIRRSTPIRKDPRWNDDGLRIVSLPKGTYTNPRRTLSTLVKAFVRTLKLTDYGKSALEALYHPRPIAGPPRADAPTECSSRVQRRGESRL
jgi:hypothetical protein